MRAAKPSIPTIIVLFGVTGDLTAKKITPALSDLFAKGLLPQRTQIIGVSRRDWDTEKLKSYIGEVIKKFDSSKLNPKKLSRDPIKFKSFLNLFTYHKARFEDKIDYQSLKELLSSFDDRWGLYSNKLFYLAVPPTFYEQIFKNLSDSELAQTDPSNDGWNRIVVEKPFGRDLKTAEGLDILLGKLFKEEQIYRIDHYLAKEMLQNILAFRFSNNLLEQSWNSKFVERIDVKLFETEDVEERADSYDPIGALRDVGQNHLLQMLSLVTMEHPQDLTAGAIRAKRKDILESLLPLTPKQITQQTFRAQYTGYQKHSGAGRDSKTETYFRIKGYFKNKTWDGVPFFLESGKYLNERTKEIIITFKHPDHYLHSPHDPTNLHHRNRVIFAIEPSEKIIIEFWAKTPGLTMKIEKRAFEFSYHNRERGADEYERLLTDCLNGDQTLFVSTEEVRAMWRFIDPIIKAWDKNLVPLAKYSPKSKAGLSPESEKS